MISTLRKDTALDRPGVRSVKPAWLSWGGKGVLTLTDQGLIAGSNFFLGILLARQLSPAQYGAYAVAFEIFLVLSMAYACLVMEPMLVFGSSTYRDNFRDYFGTLLWIHLGVACTVALLLGGSAVVMYFRAASPVLPSALVGAAFAVPWVLLFWLARRAFYVNLDPKTAVIGGLLYCGMLLCGLLLLYKLHLLSPFVAFVLMAAGALAAAPFLLWRLKPSIRVKPSWTGLREVIARHWVYGRWALAAAVASWISGNIYYILLSSMRGLADTGAFKALQNFASPIGQVAAALFTLALPYASRKYQQSGAAAVERFSWRLTPLYCGLAIAYWLVFFAFKYPVINFLYAGKYLQFTFLLPYVALGVIFRIATTVQIIALKACHVPFLSFLAWIFSDVIACLVGIPAIWVAGLTGALWAYMLSGAAGFAAGFVLLRRMGRQSRTSIADFHEASCSADSATFIDSAGESA